MKARAPRVPITPLHRVHVELEHPIAIDLKLSNISTSGMGILLESGDFPAQMKVKGRLVFDLKGDLKKMSFEGKIVHFTKNLAGVHYQTPTTDLKDTIREYFKLELAGLSTMKIDPKYHKKETDGTSTWITGDGCDLYFVMSGDQIIRFKLTFLGNHFVGSADKPLYVGQVSAPDRDESGIRYKGAEMMEDLTATKELTDSALKVLKFIPHLSAEHRDKISKMIR